MLTHRFMEIFLLLKFCGGVPFSNREIALPQKGAIDYRLPTNIIPLTYKIRLAPDFGKAEFNGSVKIQMRALKNTMKITLHAKGLRINFESVSVIEVKSGKFIKMEKVEETGNERDFLTIRLKTPLKIKEEIILSIPEYRGKLENNNTGFYYGQYVDEEKRVIKNFTVSILAPTSARKVFPCFDEPSFKATFILTLVKSQESLVTVSNTHKKYTRRIQNTDDYEDVYHETPLMSTHLLSFALGEFKISPNMRRLRFLATSQAMVKRKENIYALAAGNKILRGLENYLGMQYNIKKLDQVVLPNEGFAPPLGVLGGWGLIFFKEKYFASNFSTVMHQQTNLLILAHEIAHQWFGNLVTPYWWKFLWLSEGFATYFQYRLAAFVQKDWHLKEQFVVLNTHLALELDGFNSTRPLNRNGGSPDEIRALFDKISFEKGASLIRMMEAFLTLGVFQKGMKFYLNDRKMMAVTPDDLYKNLQKAVNVHHFPTKLTVGKIMKTWESYEGYPVVNITRTYRINTSQQLTLTQQKFSLDKTSRPSKIRWSIPLNFVWENYPNFESTSPDVWLLKAKQLTVISGLTPNEWIMANKQQTGYYRVNYDVTNWWMLIKVLRTQHNKIHVTNRAQLIDDAFQLALGGLLRFEIAFNLTLYLKKETNYVPLSAFFNSVSFLNVILEDSSIYNKFKGYVLNILEGVYGYLGIDNKKDDTHMDKLNRNKVLYWSCLLGQKDCRTKTLDIFKAWKIQGYIPLDLQAVVFCGAMRTATEEEWNDLFQKVKSTNYSKDEDFASRIITGLGCSENGDLLMSFLNRTKEIVPPISEEKVLWSMINSDSSVGVNTALNYIEGNMQGLNQTISGEGLRRLLDGIGARSGTTKRLIQMKRLKANARQGIYDVFSSGLSNVAQNVRLRKRRLPEIARWLNGHLIERSKKAERNVFWYC